MEEKYKGYEKTLTLGLEQRKDIEGFIDKIYEKGIDNLYLVGCGGSLAVMMPLAKLIYKFSDMPCYTYSSNEFVHEQPKSFTDKSFVILSSYTGTTKETVKAAQMAKEKNAPSLAFAGKADTPLGQSVDIVFANEAPMGVTEGKLIMLYQVILYLLKKRGDISNYDEWIKALELLPEGLAKIRSRAGDRAKEFVDLYKDSDLIMFTGSGINWGETYAFAMCYIQEMQWINAQWVHAGEFFHGAFETLVEDTNLVVLHGEDATRPLTQRVIDFAEPITKNYHLVDTKNHPIEGLAQEFRGYLSPFILMAVLARYADDIAEARNHPLTTRRYMGKVKY